MDYAENNRLQKFLDSYMILTYNVTLEHKSSA